MARRTLSPDGQNGLRVTIDTLPDLQAALAILVRDEVLVGVPEETTERTEEDGTPSPITSAALAYIHDNGAPEVNIPPRPFMIPGIERAQGAVTDLLAKQAQYVLTGNTNKVQEGFERVGLTVVNSIQHVINEGVPPPLADATVRRREAKGRKVAAAEMARRDAGLGASLTLAKPLIDTAEMLKSITYVVRNRNKRRK